MAAVLLILGLLAFLFLVIDWRELRGVLALGGWASATLFIVLAILIVIVLTNSPEIGAAAPAHHG